MSMKTVNRILNKINADNIDDAIYTYATLLERLVEIRKKYDEDELFLMSDTSEEKEDKDAKSSSDESLIEVTFDFNQVLGQSKPQPDHIINPENYQ